MSKPIEEIPFSLVNSDSVEIIELSESLDLGSEAEKSFANSVCGGYLGRVGTHELARNLAKEIQSQNGAAGSLVLKSPTHLLLIPHHFSVRAATDNYFRSLSSIGIIVEYDPGEELFGIVDLLPNPRFKKAFEARIQGDVKLSYSTIMNVFGLGDIVGTLVSVLTGKEDSSLFDFTLDFGYSFFATEVAAVGVGTTTAVFEFFSGTEPLAERDLTAWSAIALNKHATELSYRIKLFYVSRAGLIPKRCESEWIPCRALV
jgi:hypothetical protein